MTFCCDGGSGAPFRQGAEGGEEICGGGWGGGCGGWGGAAICGEECTWCRPPGGSCCFCSDSRRSISISCVDEVT